MTLDSEPLFSANDIRRGLAIGTSAVAEALKNMKDAVHKVLIKKEDLFKLNTSLAGNDYIPPSGKYYVTEAGLYKLIIQSRKPEAEAFKDWIAETVLPSIRKNGYYGNAPVQPSRNVLLHWCDKECLQCTT